MPNYTWDWVATKKLIAQRREYHWRKIATQYPVLDDRLRVIRRTMGNRLHDVDGMALHELARETRMDIALSRVKRLVTPPVELQQVAQNEPTNP